MRMAPGMASEQMALVILQAEDVRKAYDIDSLREKGGFPRQMVKQLGGSRARSVVKCLRQQGARENVVGCNASEAVKGAVLRANSYAAAECARRDLGQVVQVNVGHGDIRRVLAGPLRHARQIREPLGEGLAAIDRRDKLAAMVPLGLVRCEIEGDPFFVVVVIIVSVAVELVMAITVTIPMVSIVVVMMAAIMEMVFIIMEMVIVVVLVMFEMMVVMVLIMAVIVMAIVVAIVVVIMVVIMVLIMVVIMVVVMAVRAIIIIVVMAMIILLMVVNIAVLLTAVVVMVIIIIIIIVIIIVIIPTFIALVTKQP